MLDPGSAAPFLDHDVWRPFPHCIYLLAVLYLLTLVLLQESTLEVLGMQCKLFIHAQNSVSFW